MTTMPAVLPQNLGKLALYSGLSVLALLIVLSGFGLMPGAGSSPTDDGRYDELAVPDQLGGFPRWHGMVDGELADAKQFARTYHARAVEATYLPPGMDPVLATAVRARDPYREPGGSPYGPGGKVLCNSAGVFVECYRAGAQLTVDVLAPKAMSETEVARLVSEFWRAQTLSTVAS